MSNKDYEEYVKKYSEKHKISKAEAETHLLVKNYKRYKGESSDGTNKIESEGV